MKKLHFDAVVHFLVYALFVCSTFSMAGGNAASILLYIVFLVRATQHREVLHWNVPLLWPILAMVVTALFSALVNPEPLKNLSELRDIWRFALPFFLWKALPGIREERLLRWFLFMLIVVSVYGILQHYWGIDWLRPEGRKKITPYTPDFVETGVFHAKGNFSHHLTYAHYLLLIFPVFLSLAFVRVMPLGMRWMSGLGSLAMLGGLFLSLGRSAWLGAAAALGILALQLPRKVLLGGIGLMLLGAALLVPSLQLGSTFETYQQDITSPIKARLDSLFTLRHHRDRLFLWETAVLAIQDHFWFGIGLNNDDRVMEPYRAIVAEKYQHQQFLNKPEAGVHNIYLQTWLNFGIFGLLSYLAFWGTVLGWNLRWIRKAYDRFLQEKAILWGMNAGFVGFLVGGMFENSFRDGEVQALLFTMVGWSLYLGHKIQLAFSHRMG